MTVSGLIGLAFILSFTGVIILFRVMTGEGAEPHLRPIPAFERLRRAIGLAVEAGSRLHISIGRGDLTGKQSAAGLVGLTVIDRMVHAVSTSDNPPVATSGDASLAILTRDTLSSSYRDIGISERYEPTTGQLAGLTPFSYATGTFPYALDEKTSAHIFIGHFGNEVALITDASERGEEMTLGGTDNLPAQAILYATAREALIGEELYASGAYLGANPMHLASLRAQDVFRWVLIVVILGGILFRVVGLSQILNDLAGGAVMNLNFKAPLSTALAIVAGVVVLLSYFVDTDVNGVLTTLGYLRDFLLQGAIVWAAVAVLVGITNLASVHMRKIHTGEEGGYSFILLLSLILTIGVGLYDIGNTYFNQALNFQRIQWVFEHIQLPIETSLMAVLLVSLTYAVIRFAGNAWGRGQRTRLSLLSIVFVGTFSLLLFGTVPQIATQSPLLSDIRVWILTVPSMGGARGILLGVALGTIATGVRILTGSDRPYRG